MTADYAWIRQWGQLLGAQRASVEDDIAHARADHAPPNALYRQQNGAWRTTDEVTHPATRRVLGLDAWVPTAHDINAHDLALVQYCLRGMRRCVRYVPADTADERIEAAYRAARTPCESVLEQQKGKQ